jgi:hypothetical protein
MPDIELFRSVKLTTHLHLFCRDLEYVELYLHSTHTPTWHNT